MATTTKTVRPRFQSREFYSGSVDVLEYLASCANETTGAGVWHTLFTTMIQNLTVEAKLKGFDLGRPEAPEPPEPEIPIEMNLPPELP